MAVVNVFHLRVDNPPRMQYPTLVVNLPFSRLTIKEGEKAKSLCADTALYLCTIRCLSHHTHYQFMKGYIP